MMGAAAPADPLILRERSFRKLAEPFKVILAKMPNPIVSATTGIG
jgi:hypothetical protein